MFILKLVIDYSTYSHGKVYIFYVSVNRWLNTTYYIYCTYYVFVRSAYATLIVRFRLDSSWAFKGCADVLSIIGISR